MKDGKRHILVSGVSGRWGGLVARRLLAEPGVLVLGIDRRVPEQAIDGLDFVKADVRNPLLAELIATEKVDAAVHLAFRQRQWPREEDFDSNVLGTMQLIGSCAEAGVRHIVLRSTMAAYGALPGNPMYLPEDWPLATRAIYAYLKDALEIEAYVAEFAAEYPAMSIAVLRLAHVLGPGVTSPLTRLLDLPAAPILLGFDPLLQVLDAADAVEALALAVLGGVRGPVNVAAGGVLPLTAITGIAGRPPVPIPHWWAYWASAAAAGLPALRRVLPPLPIEPDHLRYACTGSLQRMSSDLGLTPQHSARHAIERYAGYLRSRAVREDAAGSEAAANPIRDELHRRRVRPAGSNGSAPEGIAVEWETDRG